MAETLFWILWMSLGAAALVSLGYGVLEVLGYREVK